LGKWLNVSDQCYLEATEKKTPNEKRLPRHNSEESIMEASSGEVCPSNSCWKEPLVDSQQQMLVYDNMKGATTADTTNQVDAIMHYKEVEIVLEVMDVDLQMSGNDYM